MAKKNHYVYRRRWVGIKGKTKLAGDEQSSYDSDEEAYEEQPSGFELKDRLDQTRRNKKVKHSTHRHPLLSYNILKEDKVFCTICEIDIIGRAYGCEQGCEFLIHKSCLHTPVTIKHWSHGDHQLTLLDSPEDASGVLFCKFCQDNGEGYHYHCSTCKTDLHVACAALPRWVHCNQHRYPLQLWEQAIKDVKTINCSVCHDAIILKGRNYYNTRSKFIAHIDCAFSEELEESVLGIEERLQSLKVAT